MEDRTNEIGYWLARRMCPFCEVALTPRVDDSMGCPECRTGFTWTAEVDREYA